jgi:phage terminase large subunit GpA-like protein
MLTAEKRVVVQNKKGFSSYEWHKDAGARNEAFDTRNYARAALRIMSPKDDSMLKRIFLGEPWAASGTSDVQAKRSAEPVSQNAKPKKKGNRNKRARDAGIVL